MSYTSPGTDNLPVNTQVVVLYDRKSGEIVHLHQALFFSATRSREAKETFLTDLVKKVAKEINPALDMQAYDVLHSPDFDLRQTEYRVDVGRKQLVEAVPV